MEFTEDELELLFDAWALAREGKGIVVNAWMFREAHRLTEAGWLERKMLENGDASWWWTAKAETVLDLNTLMQSVEGREN